MKLKIKKQKSLLLVLCLLLTACSGGNQDNLPNQNQTTKSQSSDSSTETETKPEEKQSTDQTQTESTDSEKKTIQSADSYTFVDDCGREVVLNSAISRVAPSGSLAQMIIYSLAPETLVGLSGKIDSADKKYFLSEYSELPVFGQFYGKKSNLNMEELIKAKPDIIIDMGQKKKTIKEDMDAISQQTGIPTIFIEATTETYATAYQKLGAVLGKDEAAKQLSNYIEQTLDEAKAANQTIQDKIEKEGVKKRTIAFGTGEDGLNMNAEGSVQAAVIDIIGAKNAIVVEKVSHKGGGNTITMEELIKADPDVILFCSGGPYQTAEKDTYWQSLRAIQEKQYYEVPDQPYNFLAMPPSINQILGIKWLGNLVYPEQYPYDMTEVVKEFYRLFWHYELTDQECQAILLPSQK